MGEPARYRDRLPARRRERDRDGATVTARERQRDSVARRLRRQARPHLVLAGLAAGGGLAHVLADAAGAPGPLGAAAGALGAVTAAGAVRRRGGGTREAVEAAAAAGWLGWTTATGLSWDALATLALGGYGASLRLWRRWRLPDPPAAAPPTVVLEEDTSPPALWRRYIARDGGPLPGTYLSGEERTSTGVRYRLHLQPGRQHLGTVQQALPLLRSGLLLRQGQDLIAEADPAAHEAVVRLTLVRRSPVLEEPQPWPGVAEVYDPIRGVIRIGPYVDGQGEAEWLLHRDHRLHGGFVVGDTGSGKSRTLEALALGAAVAGCCVAFLDPQGGASSPWLTRHADIRARTIPEIRAVLEMLRRVKAARQLENSVYDWEGWTPSQGRPGIVALIDECHAAMANKQCLELAVELAREGGKVGIALVMASQDPTLNAFGGMDVLRSSVCSGNLLVMRIRSKSSPGVLPGLEVDPARFPQVAGYGYLVDYTGRRRTAPYRGYYLTDEARERAGREVIWPELDAASAAVAGEDYLRRREREEESRLRLLAELEALRAGRPALVDEPERPVGMDQEQRVRYRGLLPVPTFPRLRLVTTGPSDARVAPPPAPPVETAVDAVAAALRAGARTPAELQSRTGYGETSVRQALRALAEQGRARRVRHGVWELVQQAAE